MDKNITKKNEILRAAFFTLPGLFVLCALGVWQLQRLTWKEDIIQKLEGAYSVERPPLLNESNVRAGDFAYGRIEGVLRAEAALLLGPRVWNEKIGYDVIIPLEVGDGSVVLVNAGWTQRSLAALDIARYAGQAAWFEGLARQPHWNVFTPENVPEKNQWFKADTAEIAREKNFQAVWPVLLYAEKASHNFEGVHLRSTRFYPPNNHLQYAIFWFAMAGVLSVVYVLRFVKGRV